MSAQDVEAKSGRSILRTISEATSLRLSVGGIVLTIVSLALDQTGVIGHTIPPLMFIWGVAATVLGALVYGIIWLQAPN